MRPRLLVVDDEPELVDLYAISLRGDYEVETAYGGQEALDLIEDGETFDVALIDRRMPDVSGDEVLDRLVEAVPDCRVAMVTAVEPDLDVLDMPFDEYIVKPISKSDIHEAVSRLLRLEFYREKRQEGYALASKAAALRAHKDPAVLEGSEEYRELVDRLEAVRNELDDTVAEFETADFATAFSEIGDDEPVAPTND